MHPKMMIALGHEVERERRGESQLTERRSPTRKEHRGLHVLGSAFQAADPPKTVRARDGEATISHGPVTEADQFVAGIEVVS